MPPSRTHPLSLLKPLASSDFGSRKDTCLALILLLRAGPHLLFIRQLGAGDEHGVGAEEGAVTKDALQLALGHRVFVILHGAERNDLGMHKHNCMQSGNLQNPCMQGT